MEMEIIRQSGYKVTPARKLVFEILKGTHKPMSAKNVFEAAAKKIDMASVYRALQLFVAIGIAYKEKAEDMDLYYLAEKKHHHIICRECGYSECIPCDHIFRSVKNFSKIDHDLSISGLCKNCS